MNPHLKLSEASSFALILLSLFISLVLCDGSQISTLPSPLSLPPSLDWDGNDGKWSSFAIQIGTPPQAVRLLPSTGGQSIWTVLSLGCTEAEGTSCANSRGNLFNPNKSTTWEEQGLYKLPLGPQHYLPYSGNAEFGFENITLDWQGHEGVSLSHQVVGGYVTEDFRVGFLGISPLSVNISSPNDQFPSFLGTLSEKNLIPSTSYGYLAGASYYSYPISAFGSLTFGGYDSTRLDLTKNLTLAGGSDAYRPILLGIESITSGSDTLLSDPIITALDSLVSQIWLPVSACKAFESAFGLTWNDTYSLYMLDDTQHKALLAKNASITFELSTGVSNEPNRLNITLPYAAFDLEASYPLAGAETIHYFPLKQAANDTQYTLGRTFLQEVYMIADYARGDITLYPAVYPETSVESNLVTICPLNATSCVDIRYPTTLTPKNSSKFPVGAAVGGVVGVLAVLGLGLWFALRRRNKKRAQVAELEGSHGAAGTTNGPETGFKQELADTQRPIKFSELEGPRTPRSEILKPKELDSGSNTPLMTPRQELEGGFTGNYPRYEMAANENPVRHSSIAKGRWVT